MHGPLPGKRACSRPGRVPRCVYQEISGHGEAHWALVFLRRGRHVSEPRKEVAVCSPCRREPWRCGRLKCWPAGLRPQAGGRLVLSAGGGPGTETWRFQPACARPRTRVKLGADSEKQTHFRTLGRFKVSWASVLPPPTKVAAWCDGPLSPAEASCCLVLDAGTP